MSQLSSDRSRGPRMWARGAVLCCLIVAMSSVAGVAHAAAAGAVIAPDRAPILIVDGGLGDVRFYVTHWLGGAQDVGAEGSVRLLTSNAPRWWNGTGAPDTYVLTASDTSGSIAAQPLGVQEITWALDLIAQRNRVGKVVLVAQGASGLTARSYLEDLASPKQSSRADVVGLVMIGTPNGGLSLPKTYPNLDVWGQFSHGAGLTPADLAPGSPLLTTLDSGRFPAVVRTLGLEGVGVLLGDRETDGVALRGESVLATGVAQSSLDYVPVKARASESWNARKTWLPASKQGGATLNVVDDATLEKLAMARGYSTAPDVQDAVKTFYKAYYLAKPPITHVSTRLVFDVSGSMAEKWATGTKLDGGRKAAADFSAAMAARQALPGAVPEDIGLVVFNENPGLAVPSTSDPSAVTQALAAVGARGNTDIGKALRMAVDSFAQSPKAADKFVVLLSDGVNTAGLDRAGILAGPVADAAKAGIRVDTIALGSVGGSDVGFLTEVSTATGGTFHQANDLFELRRDFLRARYSRAGSLTVDVQVALAGAKPLALGTLGSGTRMLEVCAVPDGQSAKWQILRDGTPLPDDAVKSATSPDGAALLAVLAPPVGVYTLKLVDATGSQKAHIFATVQTDAFRMKGAAAPPDNNAMMLLVVAGVLGIAAIGGVTFASIRGRTARPVPVDDGSPQDDFASDLDEPGDGER